MGFRNQDDRRAYNKQWMRTKRAEERGEILVTDAVVDDLFATLDRIEAKLDALLGSTEVSTRVPQGSTNLVDAGSTGFHNGFHAVPQRVPQSIHEGSTDFVDAPHADTRIRAHAQKLDSLSSNNALVSNTSILASQEINNPSGGGENNNGHVVEQRAKVRDRGVAAATNSRLAENSRQEQDQKIEQIPDRSNDRDARNPPPDPDRPWVLNDDGRQEYKRCPYEDILGDDEIRKMSELFSKFDTGCTVGWCRKLLRIGFYAAGPATEPQIRKGIQSVYGKVNKRGDDKLQSATGFMRKVFPEVMSDMVGD